MRPHPNDWISASEIADFVYCSKAFSMKRAGVRPAANHAARQAGSEHHRAIGRRVRRAEGARRLALALLVVALGLAALLILYWTRAR